MPTGFYDFGPILSFNAVINMITGGRGIGKSYGFKKICINSFIKRGEQFMYVRRFKSEIKEARAKFFDDIVQEFPDYVFRISGSEAQIARIGDKKKNWQTMGYFVALTTAQSLKSVPYPKVKRIGFDEYIAEKGFTRYIEHEVHALLNLYSTVDRSKDTTILFMMANAVSISNPYFIEWGIKPIVGQLTRYGRGGFIVADFPSSDEYRKSISGTRLSQFIEGTEYGDFAMANEFADNAPDMIGAKTSEARYLWSLDVSGGIFSIWRDEDASPMAWFAQKKRPKEERILTLLPSHMNHDKLLMSYADEPIAATRTAFRRARMHFDEPATREALLEIFKR